MSNKVDAIEMDQETKRGLTPKLRFPEFQDALEWEQKKLHQIAQPVSDKVTDSDISKILTLSSEHGIVLQSEYFGKKIAGENIERYIKIALNDFVYNDRTTKLFAYGTIKRLSQYESGIVSPIYKCFRFNDGENPIFWEWYFESGSHDAQLHSLVNEGARAGRFNISIEKFLSTKVCLPDPEEQQKIADCLSSLDELIAAQSQKLDTLKVHKKGLLQQLFPAEGETVPRLRFPEFQDAGEWKDTNLGKLGITISGLTYSPSDIRESGLLVLRSSNIKDGVIVLDDCVYVTTDIKGANLSKPNDILICVRNGSTALIGKNAIIPEGVPLSTHGAFMTVFRAQTPKFVYQLFQTEAYQSQVAADLGARINSINNSRLINYSFLVPAPSEQIKIANCLSSIDEQIAAQSQKLDMLKTHKKGLMQQLFPSPDEVPG